VTTKIEKMANFIHKINFGSGLTVVAEPQNFESATASITFTKSQAQANFGNMTLIFKDETARKIYAVYEQGKKGGKGVSSALPYQITDPSNSLSFDLMLIMGHSSTRFSCDMVEIPAWPAQGQDWLEKNLQAFPFWLLEKDGQITYSDYKITPYVITEIPNYGQVVTLSISLVFMVTYFTDSLQLVREKGQKAAADIAEAAIPIVGTPHIPVAVFSCIDLGVRSALMVIQFGLIVKTANDIGANIIQRPKYKLCMREADIWTKIAQKLNVGLVNSINTGSFLNATWMPAKSVMPKVFQQSYLDTFVDSLFDRAENEVNNPNAYGHPDGLFIEFVTEMELKYNAEAVMINGTLHFRQKNSTSNPSNYTLPNTSAIGFTSHLPKPHGTNLSELNPYYGISFAIDESELNTIHKYRGTSAAIQIISPFPIDKYSGWGTGFEGKLNHSLLKRHDYLTKTEQFFSDLIDKLNALIKLVLAPINAVIAAVNLIIKAVNAILKLWNNIAPSGLSIPLVPLLPKITITIPNNISKRIGWGELSNDTFSIPKTFIGVQVGNYWEVDPQSETIMSAYNLLNTKHDVNLATRGNQWTTYEDNRVKFCIPDYNKIKGKNLFTAPGGGVAKFDVLNWTMALNVTESIEWRKNEVYLSGLSEKLTIDGIPQ